MIILSDTGSRQTAVIAGSVGGTLTVVVIVLITVFLVYRRYTCICGTYFDIIKFDYPQFYHFF